MYMLNILVMMILNKRNNNTIYCLHTTYHMYCAKNVLQVISFHLHNSPLKDVQLHLCFTDKKTEI